MKKQDGMSLDEEITLSCAMRYAIGRMTYVVGSVCSELRRNYNRLPAGTKARISREIHEYQDQYGNAGMNFDNDEWNKVKWLFNEDNRVRIRAQSAQTKEWEEYTAASVDGKFYSIPEMLEYHTVELVTPPSR